MTEPPRFLPLLTYIIGIYDPYGIRHSERVTLLVMDLAKRAGVQESTQEMTDIYLAAMLHDIGKIGIPESVRRMPGRYTDPERLIMQQHSVIGINLLERVPNGGLSQEMRAIVRHHHEDWSGQGYPDGLAGEQIPFGARIVRICDTFDALTHERGYQRAFLKHQAISEMKAQQVELPWADPNLLRLFIEMMKK